MTKKVSVRRNGDDIHVEGTMPLYRDRPRHEADYRASRPAEEVLGFNFSIPGEAFGIFTRRQAKQVTACIKRAPDGKIDEKASKAALAELGFDLEVR